ncbi:putative GPI-anchor transamidase [Rosellinia necatrix]|uniref:Putative GPI-anchor transamidase n=1 Tax=Rosellinia necatrix TaxID=77044 RepID=A0A1S8A669_ROSNE|nr:putative GPI-anchor transamidase [Rosellinia necatrix]
MDDDIPTSAVRPHQTHHHNMARPSEPRSSTHPQPKNYHAMFRAIREELGHAQSVRTSSGPIPIQDVATALKSLVRDQRNTSAPVVVPMSAMEPEASTASDKIFTGGITVLGAPDGAPKNPLSFMPGQVLISSSLSTSQHEQAGPRDFPASKSPEVQHPLNTHTWLSKAKIEEDTSRLGRIQRAIRCGRGVAKPDKLFNLLSKLCGYPLIMTRIGEFLEPGDILTLYTVSKDFHLFVNASLTSSVMTWIRHRDNDSAEIATFTRHKALFIPDPAKRPLADFEPGAPRDAVRMVPSIR